MPPQLSAVQTPAMTPLAARVHAEYREMPGLRLTVRQAARLFGVAADVADAVLHELRCASILARTDQGVFALMADTTRRGTVEVSPSRVKTLLKDASLDRLVCLQRHWMWADEALARFDRELAHGWDADDDPMFDRPFGAYYHWCALLCAFAEAALDDGLLSAMELDPIQQDLEASLPLLRACRQVLVVIPASLEHHPRVVELLREGLTVPRLRRIHQAFGEALRHEHGSREIDSLDQ